MPDTCGQGLAERSALPSKLSALSAAMADNLHEHQRTLDLTDKNARAEYDAYDAVAGALRSAAAQLRAIADRMAGYRELPMARHDQRAMMAPELRNAFARFIEREDELAALLNTSVEHDRAMLGNPSTSSDAGRIALSH